MARGRERFPTELLKVEEDGGEEEEQIAIEIQSIAARKKNRMLRKKMKDKTEDRERRWKNGVNRTK